MPHARRARSIGRRLAIALVAISVVAHAAFVGGVEALDLLAIGGGGGEAMPEEVAAAPVWEAETTCEGDATLAAAARAALCATPLATADCRAQAAAAWHRDLARCRQILADAQDAEPVEIALLDDAALADIKPMPILPMLEQEQQQEFEKQQQQELEKKQEEAVRVHTRVAADAQVIEVTRPELEMAPDRARYLSEYDTKVERQTVARGSTEEMAAKPGPRDLPVAGKENLGPQTEPAKESPFENERGTGALDMRRPGPTEVPLPVPATAPGVHDGSQEPVTADGLAPRHGQTPRLTTRPSPTQGEGGPGGELGRPRVPDLRPTEELLTRVTGGGSVDKIDDADDGESTALNSKRWKFAGFFNRMKRQVAQNWHPDRVYLQRDPNGNVYGTRDRITVLKVNLNPDGSLSKVYVQQGCGVDFLDDEAVRAFRAAQPFPNPPTGLVNGEGISFSFGFHFQIGGSRERWRVFRYQ